MTTRSALMECRSIRGTPSTAFPSGRSRPAVTDGLRLVGIWCLAAAGERDRSSLSIGLLNIDIQSALHVIVCAVPGAVALALGIVSPELRLRRGFGAGAPGQRGSYRGQEQDAEHTETLR